MHRLARGVLLSLTAVAIVVAALAPAVASDTTTDATSAAGTFALAVTASPSTASVGDTVTYTYEATSEDAADYAATDVQVVDDLCGTAVLAPSADATLTADNSLTFSCSRAVASGDANPLVSHAQLEVRASAVDPWLNAGDAVETSVELSVSSDSSESNEGDDSGDTTTTTTTDAPESEPTAKSAAGGTDSSSSVPSLAADDVSALGVSSPGCPFADVETATECQITAAWTVGGGGVAANNFPAALPGPFAFHKTLHIFAGGNINASTAGAPGITLTIDGTVGGTGALIMDTGALINTNDIAGNNQSAGPITITAAGGAQLAPGSTIRAQNTSVNGNGGAISLTFGGDSLFAGLISSQALAGTTGNNGGNITIGVTGNLVMAPTSVVISEKNANGGASGDIALTVSGDMLMQGTGPTGALISARHPGATNAAPSGNVSILVGNYLLLPGPTPQGVFTMENGSVIDTGGNGAAGDIEILVGRETNIDGDVLSESTLSGGGSGQAGGGPITVETGCELNVFDNGLISSKGQDQGADLVHLEGCDVWIYGVVQSTVVPGGGHADDVNNLCNAANAQHAVDGVTFFTGCVEIWGQNVWVDNTGAHNGNVNVDGIRSDGNPNAGWIDVMASIDIFLKGEPSATGTQWTLSAVSHTGTGQHAGRITAQAGGKIAAQGLVARANFGGGNGSTGGRVDFQAGGAGSPAGDVNLDTDAFIEAIGASAGGGTQRGGVINMTSFHGAVSGTAPGHLDASGAAGVGVPAITINQCLAGVYSGATNPAATVNTGGCLANIVFPANVAASFVTGTIIWESCEEFGPGTKSGMKFNDLNGNGTKDAGEPGIANWPINLLTTANALVTSVNTDVNGNYTFTLPTPGTFRVCEGVGPAGFVQTMPNAGTIHPGETIINTCPAPNVWGYEFVVVSDIVFEGNDFGNFNRPSKLGLKFEDTNGDGERDEGEPVIEDWPINLYMQVDGTFVLQTTVNTAGDGTYSFGPLSSGIYRVCEGSVAGWVQTFPNADTDDPSGEAITSLCPAPNTFGYQFTATSGTNITGNDFGNFEEPTKSGLKFEDTDGDGVRDEGEPVIEDWPINLYMQVDGTFVLQTTVNTAGDGTYSFGPLSSGIYRVCEGSVAGWVQTFPNADTDDPSGEAITSLCPAPNTFGYQFTATSGVDITGNDFGNFEEPTKSGLKFEDTDGDGVRDEGEPVIEDWPINLYMQVDGTFVLQTTVNTAGDGTYSFGPLSSGIYRVCEGSVAGWVQTFPNADTDDPSGEAITSLCPAPNTFGYQFTATSGVDITGNDFGNFEEPTKSGLKFEDTNGDGERDEGEPTIAAWPINLYMQVDGTFVLQTTVNTAGDGTYSFGPLSSGIYRVCEGSVAGWVQTFPNADTDDPTGEAITSLCPAPNTFGYQFTVTSGTNLTGNDFGNTAPQPGTITIVKNAVPDGPADFSFTASGGLTPVAFVLDDDDDNTNSNTQVLSNVVLGTLYTITEIPTDGFNLSAIDCTGGTTATDLPNGQVAITVQAGDAVVCTFTNTEVVVSGITTQVPPAVQGVVTQVAQALAFTGSSTGPLVWGGVAALLIGAMLVLVARRRRKGIEV